MTDAVHIVCPHCHAVNRLPSARLADGGKCGSCHRGLFDGHPAVLSDSTFQKHIERTDVPVVVDFWASWCGPCRTMAPIFEQAAAQLEPGIRLAKLDTDAAPGVSARFHITGIPTLIVFRKGAEVARTSGAMPLQQLLGWIRSATGVAATR